MTEAEIATAEAALEVTLPDHYRRFLLNYPQSLIDNKLDLGWIKEAPADRQLYKSPPRLIALNRHLRLPGTTWSARWATHGRPTTSPSAATGAVITLAWTYAPRIRPYGSAITKPELSSASMPACPISARRCYRTLRNS
jgi:hypothetical protein